jgi:hypothetical protein
VTEGLATWAAGKYWEAWQKVTPTEMVRSYQREKRYIPLADHYKEDLKTPNNTSDCLAQRDLAYASWASFLDFLINKYGMEKLRQLLGPLETEVTGQFGQTGRLIRIPDGPNFDPKLAELFGFVTVDATQIDVVQGLYQPDPDFQKAYGITLTELEKTWLEQLKP